MNLPDSDDPYVLLDVRPGASTEQIRRAYLRRVKIFKPDRYPAQFRRIREAYDQLREQDAWINPRGTFGDPPPEPEPDEPKPTSYRDLEALVTEVHDGLIHERWVEVAARLLRAGALAPAYPPEFSTLLLEASCALVWADPDAFDALMSCYGDLIAPWDSEYHDGALLHRRTLTDELHAWNEATAAWPSMRRFMLLGSSLRASDEAELGLQLGQQATIDPPAFLSALDSAVRLAPNIVAFYISVAERWSRLYSPLCIGLTPPPRPTVDAAAAALADRLGRHRWVRWEQTWPILWLATALALLFWSPSPGLDLTVIGSLVIFAVCRAGIAGASTRIYRRTLRPAAARWLWSVQTSPTTLANALHRHLPAPSTWTAVLHPADLSHYVHLLSTDLALVAYGMTASMIPQLVRGGGRSK